MPRRPKIQRQARSITIQGGEEVYTRLSKREYERRRDWFDDPELSGYDKLDHLKYYDYDDWVGMGTQGGRPRKWPDEKTRKRATRAQQKLAQDQPLTHQEKELLGLIKKRPGAYKSTLGRPMTPAERQRAQRAKQKAEQAELDWLEEGL